MKLRVLIPVVIILLLACGPATLEAATPLSPTPPVALPTITLSPILSTALPSMAIPSLTATALPPPLPTLLSNPDELKYQLVQPPQEGFLALIDALNSQYGYFSRFYDGDGNPRFGFLLDQLSELLAVMDLEIKQHYPDGFPNPELVWKYYPLTSRDSFPVFPAAYLDSLTNGVLHKINQLSGDLRDQQVLEGKGYKVQVYQIELDHDPQPEWLVRMDWEELAALSWLVLDKAPGGGYSRLSQSLPDRSWIIATSTLSIEALQDFTGDDLTDIIFLNQGYMAGTDSYSFYIAKGTKDGFEALDSIGQAISVTNFTDDPAYTIDIPSGSKWLTLTVSDPHNINWGCAWNTKTSYRWPNGVEQITITGKDVPGTPECSLARAVKLYDSVDNHTAIRLLEDAVAHFDDLDEKQLGKSLFARYRLAVLYALSDKDALAREHLQWFVDHLPDAGQGLKSQLLSVLDMPGISAISLCDRLSNAPPSELPSTWENYIDATAALHAYPLSNEIYPPAICPLQDVILDTLKQADMTAQPISEKGLEDQGIPVSALQMYPFPNLQRPAIFMLAGEKQPYVAGYVPGQEGWEWKILQEFDAAQAWPQTFFGDVTGDGYPELAYFQRYLYWYCPDGEQGYQIFLTTSAGTGFVSLTHHVCSPVDQPIDLTQFLPDENGDGVVDWVTSEIRQAAGESALSAAHVGPATWFTPDEIRSFFVAPTPPVIQGDLIDEIYEGKNVSAVRQKLIIERENLDIHVPYASHKWQKLTFLIAVTYEIEGKNDQAVQEFLSLLRAEEATLWQNLAELHLRAQ